MDNGLVQERTIPANMMTGVLILIVVDNGLVPSSPMVQRQVQLQCLNPYCSGQWPRTVLLDKSRIDCLMSLNPCCSGQWSRTMTLRMVKYGLKVLILVVVDNGLVQVFDDNTIEIVECLNPCCSGQWSRTYRT